MSWCLPFVVILTCPIKQQGVRFRKTHQNIESSSFVQVITRINYGQSVYISGLAGTVSLAGSSGGLWSIKGGNWKMAAGLINQSDVALHLHEEIESIADLGDFYELNSTKGNSYACEVAVVATPLDESNIQFIPQISVSKRKMQHTHTTFVRGLLNPVIMSGVRNLLTLFNKDVSTFIIIVMPFLFNSNL